MQTQNIAENSVQKVFPSLFPQGMVGKKYVYISCLFECHFHIVLSGSKLLKKHISQVSIYITPHTYPVSHRHCTHETNLKQMWMQNHLYVPVKILQKIFIQRSLGEFHLNCLVLSKVLLGEIAYSKSPTPK